MNRTRKNGVMMWENLRNSRGFSLLELVIAIGVIAILAAIATPIVGDYLNRQHFNSAALDMLASLRLARLTAVEKNRQVVFAVNVAAGTYQAFVNDGAGSLDGNLNGVLDDAENWTREANERWITGGQLPRGVTFTAAGFGGNPEFRFDNRGFPFSRANNLTGGNVTLAGAGGLTRQVTLIPSGHTFIQ